MASILAQGCMAQASARAPNPRASAECNASARRAVSLKSSGAASISGRKIAASARAVTKTRRITAIQATGEGQLPPDTPAEPKKKAKGRPEWLQSFLQRFGPIAEKPEKPTVLDFEKPLVELDTRINEVRKVAEENGVDVNESIRELEERAKQLRQETYSRLTPTQKLMVARHPNRPTFLDIALNITDKWVELHGDRGGYDDPALVCGIGSIDGVSFMFMGHQKGRNTKENIHRNFGMPTPNGYRKALRFMRHADKFGMPILAFIDTPGAYAGRSAEELGQGEAIAKNLWEMFGIRVPIISVVIGEGGSGGALAIGCSDKSLIMENAVYYVASPEACAAILWKSRDKAKEATEALRITPAELIKFKVMDEVIPEPDGAAHGDPLGSFPAIKDAIMSNFKELAALDETELQARRYAKFRTLGQFREFQVTGGEWEEADRVRKEAVENGTMLFTEAGTPVLDEEEKEFLEMSAKAEDEWNEMLEGKDEWLMKPDIPSFARNPAGIVVASAAMKVAEENRAADSENAAVEASA